MSPELLLAILQTIRLGAEILELAQTGELTPEEAKERWEEVRVRVERANELWEQSG